MAASFVTESVDGVAPPPRPGHPSQERVLELPGLIGGEAGEQRLALHLPPPDLEEDGIMEKDEMPEELLEAAGGDGEAPSNADKRKFAEEQYERALKETEAQGEQRRKAVADAVALCAATVAPPDAEDDARSSALAERSPSTTRAAPETTALRRSRPSRLRPRRTGPSGPSRPSSSDRRARTSQR